MNTFTILVCGHKGEEDEQLSALILICLKPLEVE